VQEIVALANLDMPVAGTRGGPGPVPQALDTDCLAPLKNAIEQARYTASAAARELTDPEETVLRGFGKQLGSSKKEIMTMSKALAVGQSASVAMEATRLANEACEAIKTSRESIRAALREMGAASDLSEARGPVRARPLQQGRPVMGKLEPAGTAGNPHLASATSPPPRGRPQGTWGPHGPHCTPLQSRRGPRRMPCRGPG
jgi:hypothetical protein